MTTNKRSSVEGGENNTIQKIKIKKKYFQSRMDPE